MGSWFVVKFYCMTVEHCHKHCVCFLHISFKLPTVPPTCPAVNSKHQLTVSSLWFSYRAAVSTSPESRTISPLSTPSTTPTTPAHRLLPPFTPPHPLLPIALPHPPVLPPLQFHPHLPPCPLLLRLHLPTGRHPPPDLLLGLLSRTQSSCSGLLETLGRRLLCGVRISLSS